MNNHLMNVFEEWQVVQADDQEDNIGEEESMEASCRTSFILNALLRVHSWLPVLGCRQECPQHSKMSGRKGGFQRSLGQGIVDG